MKTKIVSIMVGCFCTIFFGSPSAQAVNVEFHVDAIIRLGDDYDIVSVYDTPPDVTTVHMFGGSLGSLQTYDSSIVNIHNGEIWWSIAARDFSTVSIHGGSVNLEYLAVSDSGTLNIYAGDLLAGNSPYFSESSTVNIYGYGFNYGSNRLTGFLSDGSSFAFNELPFGEYSHMNLVVIPEPGTLFLLGLGTLWLRKRNNCK